MQLTRCKKNSMKFANVVQDTVELEVVGNSKPAAIKRDTLNMEGAGHGAGDSAANGTP
jgi:hypothetical protein